MVESGLTRAPACASGELFDWLQRFLGSVIPVIPCLVAPVDNGCMGAYRVQMHAPKAFAFTAHFWHMGY
jgi:hypothetical protein